MYQHLVKLLKEAAEEQDEIAKRTYCDGSDLIVQGRADGLRLAAKLLSEQTIFVGGVSLCQRLTRDTETFSVKIKPPLVPDPNF